MQAKTFICFAQRNKDEPRRYDFTKPQIVAFRTALGFVGTSRSYVNEFPERIRDYYEMPDGSMIEFCVMNDDLLC